MTFDKSIEGTIPWFEKAKELTTFNDATRTKIQITLLELQQAICDGLYVLEAKLGGLRFAQSLAELQATAGSLHQNILMDFNELKICAGIRHVCDQFKQIFGAAKLVVDVSTLPEVAALFKDLEDQERQIIDLAEATVSKVLDEIWKISDWTESSTERLALVKTISQARVELHEKRQEIKGAVKKIFVVM
ncbi:MAG: hypothetical protein C0473_01325 [Cyanobacteria bacterium DS3.002]|nr:hypothetical protein [Cyanobacteria bacterium DS3.002]MBA4049748.1 hypothetical protein [Cyanobacteria bacterium DS2.008]MBA4073449.1 hypothetical protein [Cyanobacteria bacterium PR.023]